MVRGGIKGGKPIVLRSSELAKIVPRGGRYGYDLIAHVGRRTFIDGWRVREIQQDLAHANVLAHISPTSIHDIQQKFLFYPGAVHRQASPVLRDYFNARGDNTWLIDGTLEPGTAVFFGIKEAHEGILLNSWKIPTENEDDIAGCLSEAENEYGRPERVLHDLSDRMAKACDRALNGVRRLVCHYHFVRDVGDGLYKEPQEALSKRLRAMKLQLRLKDQRSGQTQRLRKAIEQPEVSLVLTDLLNGKQIENGWSETLGREVVLAFHGWMLDYRRDGKRQGFPFDPYLLYFHRRIAKLYGELKQMLCLEVIRCKAPRVLINFANELEKYLKDTSIIAASTLYEKAFDIFSRFREVLRLNSKGPSPMSEAYELSPGEQRQIHESIHELNNAFQKDIVICSDPKQRKLLEIAKIHLERYAPYLLPNGSNGSRQEPRVRTTNDLETHWRSGKRVRRQTNGRRKLTRDFNALPAEFMLVPNLDKPTYVKLVLGSLDQLPSKFAQAGKTVGPYTHWRRRTRPTGIGRIPRKLLRKENFVENLIEVYHSQCQL